MFDQLKERLHHVQQDLSTSLKSLSTKAKEVKRSRRDELAALKTATPSAVPPVCNHDAGAELLDRFQQMWSELHKEIEASAEKAVAVDSHIQDVFLNYERRAEPLLQFQKQLMDLPRWVENIQFLTASIGKLEAEFEEVESMMLGYDDLIGHCDLLRNKHTQTAELARYTQQKLKEEGLMRVRLQEEYEQSIRLKEESQKADKIERQNAFQDVFVADMQHYKTHGEMQRMVPPEAPRTPTDINSIENFQISVNVQEQEALDDFLGSSPRSTGTRDEEADEDDEDDVEDGEVDILDVIDEESERDETAEDGREEEDVAATEKTDKAEDCTRQEQHQDAVPVQDGQDNDVRNETTVRKETANEGDDEDEEDEFDTPEEGSETEHT